MKGGVYRMLTMKGPLFRSTLFPPSSSAMKGSSLDLLAAEIETILKLQ